MDAPDLVLLRSAFGLFDVERERGCSFCGIKFLIAIGSQ